MCGSDAQQQPTTYKKILNSIHHYYTILFCMNQSDMLCVLCGQHTSPDNLQEVYTAKIFCPQSDCLILVLMNMATMSVVYSNFPPFCPISIFLILFFYFKYHLLNSFYLVWANLLSIVDHHSAGLVVVVVSALYCLVGKNKSTCTVPEEDAH